MPKYKVLITETLSWYGVLEAENVDKAREKTRAILDKDGEEPFYEDHSDMEGFKIADISETGEEPTVFSD